MWKRTFYFSKAQDIVKGNKFYFLPMILVSDASKTYVYKHLALILRLVLFTYNAV
mgnify:CR=1 FL=1